MNDAKSQEKALDTGQKSKGRNGTGRTRVFANLVYEDSAPPDWRERLTQEHVQALISPYHDKDENPDGSQKKPHWHVMVMFDSVKSQEQVEALWDRVLGENRVKHYETVNSTRGYARYLCHMDNPEKYQYDRADVVSLGGADFDELVLLGSDDRSTLKMVFGFIQERKIRYYDELINACLAEDLQSMFALITEKRTLAVTAYLKAQAARKKDERERKQWQRFGLDMDPDTGELIGPMPPQDTEWEGDENHDSQD